MHTDPPDGIPTAFCFFARKGGISSKRSKFRPKSAFQHPARPTL